MSNWVTEDELIGYIDDVLLDLAQLKITRMKMKLIPTKDNKKLVIQHFTDCMDKMNKYLDQVKQSSTEDEKSSKHKKPFIFR